MVQALVKLGEYEDRIVTMVRGQFGLKNKSEAINFLIQRQGEELLEPELKPEFIERLTKIEREDKLIHYRSLKEALDDINKT